TPMIATSLLMSSPLIDRRERERHDLVGVVAAEGHDDELHLHTDLQACGVGLGEPRLDLHVTEVDVADAERNEVPAAGAGERWRRRWEVLRRPRPEPAAPGEQVLGHLRRRAPRARALRGEGHHATRSTPAADELRLVRGPGEEVVRDRGLCHVDFRSSRRGHARAARVRSSSFTTLPVAFTGSASMISTKRGTL